MRMWLLVIVKAGMTLTDLTVGVRCSPRQNAGTNVQSPNTQHVFRILTFQKASSAYFLASQRRFASIESCWKRKKVVIRYNRELTVLPGTGNINQEYNEDGLLPV